ncbi:MAG: LCP family protein, partial [Micromonosporaceae bacterium]|nr:LCP family protein [Micromonosporaceae bacterium]
MAASTSSAGRAQVPGAIPPPEGRVAGRATVPVAGDGGGSYGPPPGGGRRSGTAYSGKRRPRWGRIAMVVTLALAVLVGAGGFFGYLYVHKLDNQVPRIDPFAQINIARPDKVAPGATNILLLGSDSRDPGNTANSRTDTIILMHIQADHKKAYLISIPRDSYVYIPKSPTNSKLGDRKAKINSAYSWGGAALTVEAVESLTKVRIDHVVMIDFAGFKQVTDALGGVDLYIDKTITSIHTHKKFTKGTMHLTGSQALDYVRQRYQFADGDLSRARHQQEFMKAIMDKASSSGTLTNPSRLNAFLQSVTKAITVDKDFSLTGFALEFHSLKGSDLTFMTA